MDTALGSATLTGQAGARWRPSGQRPCWSARAGSCGRSAAWSRSPRVLWGAGVCVALAYHNLTGEVWGMDGSITGRTRWRGAPLLHKTQW